MPTLKKRVNFFSSDLGIKIEQELQLMESDATYKTGPSFSANSELYPDKLIPFVNKHMNYLHAHPNTDTSHYMSNLRLMTRSR